MKLLLIVAILTALAAAACAQSSGGGKALNRNLTAVGDNAWLQLKPKRMAFTRMYSGCSMGDGLLWYFGGAHRGYKGNDVQLFDVAKGDWIQATPPEWPKVGSKDWKTMVSGGGRTSALSPTGRPYTEHTYQQACWQPDRKRFFIPLASSGTWEFDPAKRKWIHLVNRFKDRQAQPTGNWSHNHVVWEPTLKAPVLTIGAGAVGVYRFDHGKVKWVRLGEAPKEVTRNEFYSTYVPGWKAYLISTMKRGFFKYDMAARKLTAVEAPDALKRCQSLSYDAAGKVVIALATKRVSKRVQTVIPWALDVKTMKWSEQTPAGKSPKGQCTGNWGKLWYDQAHNVHVFVNDVRRDRQATFDGGVTETWVYRYKRAMVRAEKK